MAVRFRVKDNIAIIALASPPANALSLTVRQAISDVLDKIDARDDVKAAMLFGDGPSFSAGIDIREYGDAGQKPTIGDLCNRIENMRVPVVVGLHGVVMGGGLELALAAHYRLIERNSRIGMPEVTLGLLPSGGATQRLPRLAGAETALKILAGRGTTAR